jgi:2-oxoglutarate/2-oxoacid ferredoxin oxidoreductase subunit alpha
MSQATPTVQDGPRLSPGEPVVNDFVITFCTVNGSGSATANNTVLRALFKMGIPVAGKNVFPSNIQGLPTWYTVRVNKDGWLARLEKDHVVVAMNASTFEKDMQRLVPGGAFFYADDIKITGDTGGYLCLPNARETPGTRS